MSKFNLFRRYFSLMLLLTLSVASSKIALAQNKIMGELTISGTNAVVTVNGERVVSGRSINSPSEIATFADSTAKVSLPQLGEVILAPNSRINLSFDASSISGDFLSGKLTVDVLPNKRLNLQTADGAITVANLNEETVVNIDFENGRTRVSTLSGAVQFNGVTVAAGQIHSAGTSTTGRTAGTGAGGGSGSMALILLALAGAVGVGLAFALQGGGDDSPSPVSPVR
jgi:ferric-dicitrate binding protein FerR (iron transport regulator)